MQPPHPTPVPIGSDPALVVSYEEGARYVQARLNSFVHGDLKQWVEQAEPKISYQMAVGLKNETLLREAPKLVQRLLLAFGMDTEAKQGFDQQGNTTYQFVFRSADALALFRQQLAQIPAFSGERSKRSKRQPRTK